LNPDAPNFEDWKSVHANVLVATSAEPAGSEITVACKVYLADSGQSLLAKAYPAKADNLRAVAHQASDDIVALTQNRGVARTRIVFASDRDSTKEKRGKELYVIDYDGYNPQRWTSGLDLNILPAWNPDGRSLAYISYRGGSPEIYVASIFESKGANVTAGKAGQPYALSWSPDGRQIAYASNKTGNLEIWVANADGSDARRLTDSPGSDTAPAWSPTGREIAFTSSRSGTPQIWVMDAEGLNVRRLTTVGNWNDAPAWNPSKEFSEIAYASRLEHGREVAVIDLATRQVRQITQGRGDCESPSWAPNGRHLVFACDDGLSSQIAVSDRYGREVHTLAPGPGNNSQPDWGP
jgi:TolB protein